MQYCRIEPCDYSSQRLRRLLQEQKATRPEIALKTLLFTPGKGRCVAVPCRHVLFDNPPQVVCAGLNCRTANKDYASMPMTRASRPKPDSLKPPKAGLQSVFHRSVDPDASGVDVAIYAQAFVYVFRPDRSGQPMGCVIGHTHSFGATAESVRRHDGPNASSHLIGE